MGDTDGAANEANLPTDYNAQGAAPTKTDVVDGTNGAADIADKHALVDDTSNAVNNIGKNEIIYGCRQPQK